MARGLHWTLTFRSALNTPCRIYIYTNGYQGEPIILTGASVPFFWEEDDDNSLLTCVRHKTGYLNVIEPEYDSLSDLRPTSDTSHYIEFYYGSVLYFTGYLQSQTFENAWVASPRELSFPILSPTGLLQDLRFNVPSNMPELRNHVSIWSLLKEVVTGLNAAYEKVIFPFDMRNEGQYVNSLVFCPFNDDFSVHDGTSLQVCKGESYYSFIEAICNLYGFVMHDTPTALVFDDMSRPISQKTYYSINVEDLGTGSSPTANVVTTQGLLDIFEIYGKDHNITLERGLSYLIVTYDGEFKKSSSLPMSHCVKYRKEYVFDSFQNQTGSAVMWLKSVGPELSGSMLKYDGHLLWNNQSGSYRPEVEGIYPVCFAGFDGSERRCLFYEPNTNWSAGQELLSIHFLEHPYGDLNLSASILAGSLQSLEPAPNNYKFKFKVDVDGKYYNAQTNTWDSDTPSYVTLTRSANDSQFRTDWLGIRNVPNYGTITFTLMSDFVEQFAGNPPDVMPKAMASFESFLLEQRGEVFAEYESNDLSKERKNLYNNSGKEENITLKISFSKNNTNQITDDDGLATRASINGRLGNNQTIIDVGLRMNLVQPPLTLFGVFRFGTEYLYWNILSSAFYPRDDYYKLKIIH